MSVGEWQMPTEAGYKRTILVIVFTALAVFSAVFLAIFVADTFVNSDVDHGAWDEVAEDLDDYGGTLNVNGANVQVTKDDSVSVEDGGLLIRKANGNYYFCSYDKITSVTIKAH